LPGGTLVWLPFKHIRSSRPSKRLDHKRLVPFLILELKGAVAYRLQLPDTMRIQPVFHVWLLEPFHPFTLPGRVAPSPSHIIVNEAFEFELEEILDS
jgi:hypothetical protein